MTIASDSHSCSLMWILWNAFTYLDTLLQLFEFVGNLLFAFVDLFPIEVELIDGSGWNWLSLPFYYRYRYREACNKNFKLTRWRSADRHASRNLPFDGLNCVLLGTLSSRNRGLQNSKAIGWHESLITFPSNVTSNVPPVLVGAGNQRYDLSKKMVLQKHHFSS